MSEGSWASYAMVSDGSECETTVRCAEGVIGGRDEVKFAFLVLLGMGSQTAVSGTFLEHEEHVYQPLVPGGSHRFRLGAVGGVIGRVFEKMKSEHWGSK